MAQTTLPRPASGLTDEAIQRQTHYLFNSLLCRATQGSGSRLNAEAYQEMQRDGSVQEVFGSGVTSGDIDELVDCLTHHADNMERDTRLQRILDKIKNAVSDVQEFLGSLQRLLAGELSWSKIVTVICFGVRICCKYLGQAWEFVKTVFRLVSDTVVSVISTVAGWIRAAGGWFKPFCIGWDVCLIFLVVLV